MPTYAPHITVSRRVGRDRLRLVCTCGATTTATAGPGLGAGLCRHHDLRLAQGAEIRDEAITVAFEDVTVTDHGFTATAQPVRVSVSANTDDPLYVDPRTDNPVTICLDLRATQPVTMCRDGEWIPADEDRLYEVFANISGLKSFARVLATGRTRALLVTIDKVCQATYGHRRARIALSRFATDWPGIEPLWQAGFSPGAIAALPSSAWQARQGRLHTRLGVPRRFVSLIRDEILTVDDYHTLQAFTSNTLELSEPAFHGSPVWQMVEPMRLHCRQALAWLRPAFELVHRHNYDAAQLTDYLTHTARDYQGIANPLAAIELLLEYVTLTASLDEEPTRWPKALKTSHDVATMRTAQLADAELDAELTKTTQAEEYQARCMRLGVWIVTAPASIHDLLYEGAYLSHSAFSLAGRIVDGDRGDQVYFLRHRDDPDTPLVTLNIRYGELYQARGYLNRPLTTDEAQVITTWAETIGVPIGNLVL